MWTLIDNISHVVMQFTSEKKLREYSKANRMYIKRSYTAEKTFYTEG